MERPATVTASLYIVVFLVPGFFLYRIATSETFAVIDDYHYGVVYGSALRIALGHNPADLRINFGLISTLSAAFLAKIFAIETFGGWIRFTQFFQTFFLSCAVVSTFALERNLRLVLLVVFVTALYASTWNFLVPTPNNTGFRFLSFALLPLVLAILKQNGAFSGALIAGLASATFILWNAETGLACSAALFFYIFINGIANRQNLSGMFYAIGIAAITAALLFICTYIVFLGKSANASLALAHLVGVAAGGYNGHLFDRYTILAAGLALYASSLMIYCCLRARDATADKDLIARAALATASVVWFGYYAHNAFSFVLAVNFCCCSHLGPLFRRIVRDGFSQSHSG